MQSPVRFKGRYYLLFNSIENLSEESADASIATFTLEYAPYDGDPLLSKIEKEKIEKARAITEVLKIKVNGLLGPENLEGHYALCEGEGCNYIISITYNKLEKDGEENINQVLGTFAAIKNTDFKRLLINRMIKELGVHLEIWGAEKSGNKNRIQVIKEINKRLKPLAENKISDSPADHRVGGTRRIFENYSKIRRN
ncbi:hypothetical protein [Coxiella endosymbiont of Ornithodoros maritimus]|uniref:hypothetical protein n=1 Tax=Coxiella endosymbiont of Ornithodoros maritimus TaxID=1656172 RepID=UPI0022654129|nr:hypothetical protein [Coxiella endosymbiont of Ornithodoros maritimus]